MRVERGDVAVETLRIVVVEQQPHAHPALRRLPERFAQQVAGDVTAPDVVLHVEAALGSAREQHPRGEGVERFVERMDGGLSGVGRDRRREGAAEARAAGVGERTRWRSLDIARQAGAARERHEQE